MPRAHPGPSYAPPPKPSPLNPRRHSFAAVTPQQSMAVDDALSCLMLLPGSSQAHAALPTSAARLQSTTVDNGSTSSFHRRFAISDEFLLLNISLEDLGREHGVGEERDFLLATTVTLHGGLARLGTPESFQSRVFGESLPSSSEMLNLSYDWFRGEVPATIGCLAHLQVLDLSYNAFSGTLSSNLSSCVSLLVLSLNSNHIHGRIPVELGNRLSNLRGLLVANNILAVAILGSLDNLCSSSTLI
eukprot:XP_008680126.1 putative receptor-like protein kinase At3g47110 [Zea mays]